MHTDFREVPHQEDHIPSPTSIDNNHLTNLTNNTRSPTPQRLTRIRTALAYLKDFHYNALSSLTLNSKLEATRSPSHTGLHNPYPLSNHLSLPLWDSPTLVHELNSTKFEFVASHSFSAELQQQFNSTNLLVEALLIELTREHECLTQKVASVPGGKFNADLSIRLSNEVRAALGPHKLPVGKSPTTGLDEMMYLRRGFCLKGVNRCLTGDAIQSPPLNYVEPTPFPESLRAKAPNISIIWDPYSYKSY
ncbi:hypothetical protein Pint_18440 [Pistacia integerrima]|uniref:Uncharacterized protein n=1 Tax=Pistacia integerrima TaxID=434235 RepID=A0ACC0YWY8_9ROSI|nr:hypothetical protein Pint_18440 [Pistacia integerrima]